MDRNSQVGRSSTFEGIWFGSTWMMWYGQYYFKYIPKDRLMSFAEAFEIKQFRGGALRIQLFDKWENHEDIASRQLQKEFQDFLGIKQIVEALD